MVYVLFGIGLALLLWGVIRFAMTAPPATVARTLKRVVIATLVLAALALLVVGQGRLAVVPGLLVLPFLIPLGRRRHRGAGPPLTAPGDADVANMTREEAAEILGVSPDAGRDEIIAAHARQRALREADGASRWATARLDRARDLLLEELS